MTEQARWVTPGVKVFPAKGPEPVAIEQVQQTLGPSTVLLEYVLADPNSYCLTISQSVCRIVRLLGKAQIEPRVAAYLKAVKGEFACSR